MSAEKSEKPEAAAPAAAPAAEGAAPKGGGAMGFLPLIIALVLAPVISWVVAEFVLLPRFKMQLMAMGASAHGEAAAGEGGAAASEHKAEPKAEPKAEGKSEHKKEAKKSGSGTSMSAEGPGSYRFDNVVVNLSGTMGTRYLKTSFLITGRENLSEVFEERQPQLLDATLNTLSSLTLSDLEEVGSRNLIRARLIAAYNEAIGVRIVEQIYFSEFVVQ